MQKLSGEGNKKRGNVEKVKVEQLCLK